MYFSSSKKSFLVAFLITFKELVGIMLTYDNYFIKVLTIKLDDFPMNILFKKF